MIQGVVGSSIPRHEDVPLLRGEATFVADVRLPGQLSMRIVRSNVAHGLLRSIDTAEAAAMAGVAAVWTAADLAADVGEVPRIPPRVSFEEAVVPYLQPVLAMGAAWCPSPSPWTGGSGRAAKQRGRWGLIPTLLPTPSASGLSARDSSP